ncbi:hypothetical protein [Streptomyces olivochromogenes]|uniref:hypothetical protein n=1 Tax=Streptomyces olivochromogenes TaxID=1963 RepID=UPI001F37C1CE|nr:hypothetical protein [Streptomyces olivochromogenes]MCF3137050.1 hypothetical protein [Streptomyces olivochromogenes]
MTSQPQRRTWLWIMAVVGGLVTLGLGVYFIKVGLDQANQVAGILGLFVSIAGLLLSAYSVIQVSSAARVGNSGATRMTQSSGSNSTNIQSTGDITIGDNNKMGGQ